MADAVARSAVPISARSDVCIFGVVGMPVFAMGNGRFSDGDLVFNAVAVGFAFSISMAGPAMSAPVGKAFGAGAIIDVVAF